MRHEIVDFLASIGISRFEFEQLNEKVCKAGLEREFLEENWFHPQLYELTQGISCFYDFKVNFMEYLAKFIGNMKGTKKHIVDGGCATGIDISFLAMQFPGHKFFGYDRENALIAAAERRRKNLGIGNLEFSVETHGRATKKIPPADLLYTNGALGSDDGNTAVEVGKLVVGICRRVRSGGSYILAGMSEGAGFLEMQTEANRNSIFLIRTDIIGNFGAEIAYNYLFRVRPQ